MLFLFKKVKKKKLYYRFSTINNINNNINISILIKIIILIENKLNE